MGINLEVIAHGYATLGRALKSTGDDLVRLAADGGERVGVGAGVSRWNPEARELRDIGAAIRDAVDAARSSGTGSGPLDDLRSVVEHARASLREFEGIGSFDVVL